MQESQVYKICSCFVGKFWFLLACFCVREDIQFGIAAAQLKFKASFVDENGCSTDRASSVHDTSFQADCFMKM